MRIAFPITPQEHYRALRAITALMPSTRWAYAFFLGVPALLVIAVFVLGLDTGLLVRNWFGVLGGPLFVFGLMPLLTYWQVRSSHRTNAALGGGQVYDFTTEGMTASGALHCTKLAWNAFHRAVETERYFFLFVSNRQAYFLPRNAVMSQVGLQPFRALLDQHLPGKTKLRRDSMLAAA